MPPHEDSVHQLILPKPPLNKVSIDDLISQQGNRRENGVIYWQREQHEQRLQHCADAQPCGDCELGAADVLPADGEEGVRAFREGFGAVGEGLAVGGGGGEEGCEFHGAVRGTRWN